MGRIEGMQQVNVYLDPQLYRRVRIFALSLNKSVYGVVNEALREKLGRHVGTSVKDRKALDQLAPMPQKKPAFARPVVKKRGR